MNIRYKTEKDLFYIRKAIEIGEQVLEDVKRVIKPGLTTLKVDSFIEKRIRRLGGLPAFKGYQGFPNASCISINEEIIHGVPSDRKIKDGDVVKIDLGVNYFGYYSDQAITVIVGKPKSIKYELLVKATYSALSLAIEMAKTLKHTKYITCAIQAVAEQSNLGILKDYTGHGVGFEIHEAPRIYNSRKGIPEFEFVPLKKGMVIAIEPMFVLGEGNYIKKENGTIVAYSISAHFEKSVIIQ